MISEEEKVKIKNMHQAEKEAVAILLDLSNKEFCKLNNIAYQDLSYYTETCYDYFDKTMETTFGLNFLWMYIFTRKNYINIDVERIINLSNSMTKESLMNYAHSLCKADMPL